MDTESQNGHCGRARHYNLVFLHARRKTFPAFDEIAETVREIWPWGEVASVEEVEHRLTGKFPTHLVEATIWKLVGESAAQGHLLLDLGQFTLSRTLPLAILHPSAPPLVPGTLPDTLLPELDAIPKAPALPAPPHSLLIFK